MSDRPDLSGIVLASPRGNASTSDLVEAATLCAEAERLVRGRWRIRRLTDDSTRRPRSRTALMTLDGRRRAAVDVVIGSPVPISMFQITGSVPSTDGTQGIHVVIRGYDDDGSVMAALPRANDDLLADVLAFAGRVATAAVSHDEEHASALAAIAADVKSDCVITSGSPWTASRIACSCGGAEPPRRDLPIAQTVSMRRIGVEHRTVELFVEGATYAGVFGSPVERLRGAAAADRLLTEHGIGR